MAGSVRIAAALVGLALCAGSAYGQNPQATVSITGAVTVNGRPAPQPAAIFAGDVVQTGPDSTATIVSEGTEIALSENSSLTFSPNNLNLGCGSGSVFTKAGKSVLRTADGATITPNAPDGFNRIEVTQGSGLTLIRVVLGSAIVSRGEQTTTVRAGYMLELPGSSCTGPVSTSPTGRAEARPAGTASSPGSGALVPILIGAGGGGALAAILASRGDEEEQPVSPARP